MRSLLYFIILLFPVAGFAQDFKVEDHYVKREVYIPMRDGKKLFTAIYLPKDSTKKYPILLNRTPYSVAPYGTDKFPPKLRPTEAFAKDGYIFVFQDVRGRVMSEGDFVNMTPHIPEKKNKEDIDESSDTYDCIEWCLKNIRYHNGRVGQWGISYPGFYTAAGMIDAHPALKAVSPQAPIVDWFTGDDFHHNGALFVPHFFGFFYTFGQPRPLPGRYEPDYFQFPTSDGYRFYLEHVGPLKNINEKYYRSGIPFWNEMTEHETYDDFWKKRNLRPHLKNIRPAVLTVGGWFDAENLYGALQVYKTLETQSPSTNSKIVMGPWVHGGWNRTSGTSLGDISFDQMNSKFYQDSIEFPFFQYYLKGKGDLKLPEAFMFETGNNLWRRYDAWPPKNTATKEFYFHPSGKLSADKPSREGYDEYIADPAKPVPYMPQPETGMSREYMVADQRFASTRTDVLVYQSETFSEDFIVAGPVEVTLNIASTGTDADFIVKIIDVYPDNEPADSVNGRLVKMSAYQMLVRGDVMRAKFRKSFEKPEPLIPGQVTPVRFTLNDINHAFRSGHRLMIQVQSSWFPLVERNPQRFMNVFEADQKDFQKATQRIYYGSSVKMPVIK